MIRCALPLLLLLLLLLLPLILLLLLRLLLILLLPLLLLLFLLTKAVDFRDPFAGADAWLICPHWHSWRSG